MKPNRQSEALNLPPETKSNQRRSAVSWRGFAVASLAVSLSACASLVKPTEVNPALEVPQPEAFAEVDAALPAYEPDVLPRTDWVESFEDENLVSLVNKGRLDNPSVRRAIAQLDASLARQRISRADLYPDLNFSSSIRRSEGGVGFNAGSTSYSFGFNTSWEADIVGRIGDQVQANGLAVKASAADIAALELSVASRLASGWFDAIEAALLVELSARDIETQERSLRLTENRFENGLTGAADVRLARSNVASSKATEQLRIQNRNLTIRNLQTLIREYPDASLSLPTDLPVLPVLTAIGTPGDMLARRPDILAAEARIHEAGLNVDVARKNLYPRLSFTGSADDQALNSLGDALDFQNIAYSLSESLTAPIFRAGQLKGQVEAQRAQLQVQIENYVETVLSAYQEVENALDAESLLEAREDALRVALNEAQEAENRLELRYTEGLATILQLLDAQTRRLNAEGQLIGARAERLSNRVRLHVALGGSGYDAAPHIEDAAQPVNQLQELLPDEIIPERLLP